MWRLAKQVRMGEQDSLEKKGSKPPVPALDSHQTREKEQPSDKTGPNFLDAVADAWLHPKAKLSPNKKGTDLVSEAWDNVNRLQKVKDEALNQIGLVAADKITQDLHGFAKELNQFWDGCKKDPVYVPRSLSKLFDSVLSQGLQTAVTKPFELAHLAIATKDYLQNSNDANAAKFVDALSKGMNLTPVQTALAEAYTNPTVDSLKKFGSVLGREMHLPANSYAKLSEFLEDPKNEQKRIKMTQTLAKEMGPGVAEEIEGMMSIVVPMAGEVVGPAIVGGVKAAARKAVVENIVKQSAKEIEHTEVSKVIENKSVESTAENKSLKREVVKAKAQPLETTKRATVSGGYIQSSDIPREKISSARLNKIPESVALTPKKIEILNSDGKLLVAGEYTNMSEAVEAAVKSGVSLKNANLVGADLRKVNLKNVDLSFANLSGADLTGAVIKDAQLTGAKLSEAKCLGVDFEGVNLANADLRKAQLSGADLSKADITGAKIDGAHLVQADLSGQDLRNVSIKDADLSFANCRGATADGINFQEIVIAGTDFSKASLSGADFSKHTFSKAKFSQADLTGAVFDETAFGAGSDFSSANLQGASFKDAYQMAEVNFERANMKGLNLQNAHLYESKLAFADLEGADLTNATLDGADLRSANLKKTCFTKAALFEADLRSATLENTKFGHATLSEANLEGLDLRMVDLDRTDLGGAKCRRVNLEGKNLQEVRLDGADLSQARLSGADFTKRTLVKTDFTDADLRKAKFDSADLCDAIFEGSNLEGASFIGSHSMRWANWERANMKGLNLEGKSFESARMSSANLEGATLRGATLSGADLRSANLRNANLQGAEIINANIDGNIVDLHAKEVFFNPYGEGLSQGEMATFRSPHLDGADFTDAVISGTNMSGHNFVNTKFDKALIHNSNLSYSDFTNCSLDKAASVSKTSMKGSNCENLNFATIHLDSVDLSHANLVGADLSGKTLQNVTLDMSDVRGAILENVSFHGGSACGVNFEGSNLRRASFNETHLREHQDFRTDSEFVTTFSDCDLSRVMFHNVDLDGINFEGAIRKTSLE